MMQPPLRGSSLPSVQTSIMHRLLLSAQGTRNEYTSRTMSSRSLIQPSEMVDWANDGVLGINYNPVLSSLPMVYLRCVECGIGKCSSEDMEVHIKMEHLQWLPFQCPICSAERASDLQMREHIHSAHRKNSNKFIYVDNPSAKRVLQIMMDRSLSSARRSNGITQGYSGQHRHDDMMQEGFSAASSPPNEPRTQSPLRNLAALSNGHESPTESVQSATATVVSTKRPSKMDGHSSTDAVLNAIRAATSENPSVTESPSHEAVDDDDCLSTLFNDPEEVSHRSDPCDILGNVAAMFNAEDVDLNGVRKRGANGVYTNPRSKANSSSVSKKRVLGECSKCKKPVTAGARQMHMFYHLGKDCNIYRFRCKYPNCEVAHYRKDQMENHHSKQHGKIDGSLMEDRTAELFNSCQELSLELLGTSGNTPGPTAERAQAAYNASIAAQALNQHKKKKNKLMDTETCQVKQAESAIEAKSSQEHEEQTLQCRLCNKVMYNRIRGFHILWHMAKDLGINRYVCKCCEFGHDRSQSVQTHAKREHGIEDCVEDRIEEYSDEVKSMSEACFGFQALFSQESRKRSKLSAITMIETDDMNEESECGLSTEQQQEQEQDCDQEQEQVEHTDDEQELSPSPVQTETRAVGKNKKSSRHRRFGVRKAPSRIQRKHMARLREVSMKVGGAQYFKKKLNEAAHCQICGMITSSRMSDHAYRHMEQQLFLCPHCDLGSACRDLVARHMRDMHASTQHPIDDRFKYAAQIKLMIQQCYPDFFIDAPLPTAADMDKLKASLSEESKNDPDDTIDDVNQQSDEGEEMMQDEEHISHQHHIDVEQEQSVIENTHNQQADI